MIANRTRGTVLCRSLETARSPGARARGLMFRSQLEGGLLFVFDRSCRPGIWTFGMLIPIDILWLDSGGRVVKARRNAKPWRYLGFPRKKARFVLELPAGTLEKSLTREGDALSIPRR